MIFGRLPTDRAEGAILAHSIRTPNGVFKKGRVLSAADIEALTVGDVVTVVAAQLESDDTPEDEAAARIARAARGSGAEAAASFTGRCNLYAAGAGVLLVDHERIEAINRLDESVTIATLPPFAAVEPRQMLATVKIIPFAAPSRIVAEAEAIARSGGPLFRLAPFTAKNAGLVISRLPGTRDSVLDNTARTVRDRLARLGGSLRDEHRVEHDETAIAAALRESIAGGADLVLVSGASAVVDRRDVVPTAIERAGGRVEHFGMPVDPGNLLLLGTVETPAGRVPVIGMPGCARSPKLNGFDWVLERLAANLEVRREDIMRMGAGGLLKEISARPQPRDRETAPPPRMPRIAALLLAAGQSRRMGAVNKLLVDIDGVPMVRRIAEVLLASQAARPLVVTGHEAARVRGALEGLDVGFAHNADYANGLSTSLRCGLAALGSDHDGVLVCLGDMPEVRSADLDRMIAAFDPVEGRAIVVPTHRGKRGNPVLWGAQFLAQMTVVSGDVGARHLIGENAEWVCEVAVSGGGVLLDIDNAETLTAWRRAREA